MLLRDIRKSLVIIVFTCLPVFIFAQQDSIKAIYILDEESGEPLVGANAVVNNDLYVSDLTGKILITAELPWKIQVEYVGYEPLEKTIISPPAESIRMYMKISKTILDMVTVTGSKFERNLTESTISIDILQPDIVRSTNVSKSSDILNKVPGVQILDGQANIRGGSGYSYGAGSRVMLLVNEIPFLQVDAGFPNWGDIPIEALGQIEIVKGASSSLYGSAALNGIVNFRTSYPTAQPETRIVTSYTQYLTPEDPFKKWWKDTRYQSMASVLHKRKWKKLEIVASGFFNQLKGYLEHTDETRGRVFVAGHYKWHERLFVDLSVNTNLTESSAYFLWKDSGSGAMKALPFTITNRNSSRHYIDPALTYFDKFNNKHKWMWRYNYTNNKNDTNQSNKSINNYGEYQFQRHHKNWDVVTTSGIVAIHNKTDSEVLGDTLFSGFSWAGYFQLEKKFFEKLFASAGIRYENVSQFSPENFMGIIIPGGKASDDRWISRFGVNYEASKYTFLRASWGQGYRFPTLTERFVTTTFGAFSIFSNPLLQPETGWTFEFGVKQGIPGFMKGFLDVAFFHSEYQNMIEFTFVPPPTLGFQPQNIGNIRIRGIEASYMGQANIGKCTINSILGYTYLDPVYKDFDTREDIRNSVSTDQNVLKYRSKHLIKLDVEARYKKLKWGVSFQRASHVINIDRAFEKVPPIDADAFGIGSYRSVYNDGYYLLDSRISYTFFKKMELTVLMNNILNDEYSLRPALVEAPRNIGMRLDVTL